MASEQEPRLIRLDTDEKEEHKIPEGTTRIGRSKEMDICLLDTAVSRFHCYLVRKGGEVRVFEGESRNPAFVSGEPVNGQVLGEGHPLRIGRCEFVYQGPPASPAAAETPPPPAAAPAEESDHRPLPLRREAPPPFARVRAARRTSVPVGPIVLGLILVPGLIWLLVVVVPHVAKDSGEPAGGERASSARRLDREQEIEWRVAELQGKIAGSQGSPADAKVIAELQRTIAELRAEIENERERDRGSLPRPAGAASLADLQLPDADLDRAELMADEPGERTSARTVVLKSLPVGRKRSQTEINELVERLKARIDDYATHLVTPASMEPDLTALSTTFGAGAADGVVRVYGHARQLLRQVDASIDENRRRREAMLKLAERTSPDGPIDEGSASKAKKGHYSLPVGARTEADQRFLELTAKAVEIHSAHREHLIPLRNAVLGSMRRLTDPESLAWLRGKFGDEVDPELCRGLTAAFAAAESRDSVPVLYKKLGVTRDAGLRAAIHETLVALTGVDLGENAPAWADWWGKNGR